VDGTIIDPPHHSFHGLEWLPPGGHAPQRRLQAAGAHHGAFNNTPKDLHFRTISPVRKSAVPGAGESTFGIGGQAILV
jgi:hypothetical protein